MKKIFTGNGQITPYRPWSDDRRAKVAGRPFSKLGFDSDRVWEMVRDIRQEAKARGCSFEEALDELFGDTP